MHHHTRFTAVGSALAALTLAGCAQVGWNGEATIVEMEYTEYDKPIGGVVTADAIEITVAQDTGQEAAVVVDPGCAEKFKVGQRTTYANVVAQCGEGERSHDD